MGDEERKVCESCGIRAAIGVLRLPDEPPLHVCQICVPNSPLFDFRIYPHLRKDA